MPMQPPVFRRRGAPAPKPWARRGTEPVARVRGRRGVAERRRILREEPLCRPCLAKGLTTASEQVDHIVPLAEGGTDDRTNKQGICKPCHKTKSAEEAGRGRAASIA